MEMKEVLKRVRLAQEKKLWDQTRDFHKALKGQLDEFRLAKKREEVARSRDIEKLFSAKCRLTLD